MADTKISALPASTTPLAGTEVLPIVQSGATKQVSVANLTAGRTISATELTLSTGNLVIGTSGKGIDFSATPGTGTSELLSDYEEGTWTPNPFSTGGAITSNTSSGTYVKVGSMVTLSCSIEITNNGTGFGVILVSGLPFNINGFIGGACRDSVQTGAINSISKNASTNFRIVGATGAYPAVTGSLFTFSVTYLT